MQGVHTAMNALSQEYLRTENDWMEDRSEVPGCGSIQAAYSRVSLMDLLWFALFPPESLQDRPDTGEREAQQASWASKDAAGQRAQLLESLKEAQAALRPGLVNWFKSRGSDESHAGLLADRWLDIQLDNDFRWDNECLGRDLR